MHVQKPQAVINLLFFEQQQQLMTHSSHRFGCLFLLNLKCSPWLLPNGSVVSLSESEKKRIRSQLQSTFKQTANQQLFTPHRGYRMKTIDSIHCEARDVHKRKHVSSSFFLPHSPLASNSTQDSRVTPVKAL